MENWIDRIHEKFPVKIKILDIYSSENRVGNLVEIAGEDEILEKVIEELKSIKNVVDVDLQKIRKGLLMGSVTVLHCGACSALSKGEVFPIGAETRDDGSIIWKVISRDKEKFSKVVNELEKSFDVELLSISHLTNNEILTTRQEEILRIAFEKGFFDHPRKVTLKELARMLGISPSTLSEIIKRGERKILERYFGGV